MNRPWPEIVHCPHCGSRNFAVDDVCSSCRKGLTIVIGPRPKVRRVNLGSIMAVIAVVAVCLAPLREAPGLSLLFAVILLPAAVRTVVTIEGRKLDGRPMTSREKIEISLSSAGVCLVILVASGVAFVATCIPTGLCVIAGLGGVRSPAIGLAVACIAGAVPAFFVAYRLGRTLWPRRD